MSFASLHPADPEIMAQQSTKLIRDRDRLKNVDRGLGCRLSLPH